MLVKMYRTEHILCAYKKNVEAILNYMPSVMFEEGEAEAFGINPREIDNPFIPGEYYKTTNGKVINCLAVGAKHAYFAQFVVFLNSPQKYDTYAGKGYSANRYTRQLLGKVVSPKKLLFFTMVMFPNSKQFANPKEALMVMFKKELESHDLKSKSLSDRYIDRIFRQEWVRNVKDTPMGKFVMSSLKASLDSLGIDYKQVISYYRDLAEQVDDRKAGFMATKELERLVKEGEAEEKKLRDLNEPSDSASSEGFEVLKRIGPNESRIEGDDGPDDMQKVIMEASDQLDELGDDYINQGMNIEEAVILEEKK